MFESITKYVPLTTLILSYLFISSSLYLVGFWGIFDIDISNFLEISDVLKNFIFPFILGHGLFFIHFLINIITSPLLKDTISKPFIPPDNLRALNEKIDRFIYWFKKVFHIDNFILILIYLAVIYRDDFNEEWYWITFPFAIGVLISIKISESKFIKITIPYWNLRMYITMNIILIPILAFSFGRVESLSIYSNEKISYLTTFENNKIKSDTTLKFIGFLGDKIICSSLDNEEITVLNHSKYDKIVLSKFKKNSKKKKRSDNN